MFDGNPSQPLEHSHLKGIVESSSWKIRKVSDELIALYEARSEEEKRSDPTHCATPEEAEKFSDLLQNLVLLLLKIDAVTEELYARIYFMRTGKVPEDVGYYDSLGKCLVLPDESIGRITRIRFWRNYFSHAPSHRTAYRQLLGEEGRFIYAVKPVCREALRESWRRYRENLSEYGGPERYESRVSEARIRRIEERRRRQCESVEQAIRIRNDYRISCRNPEKVFDEINARVRSDPSVQAAPLPLHNETLRMLIGAMYAAAKIGVESTINNVAPHVYSLALLWEFLVATEAWREPFFEPVIRGHDLSPDRPPPRPKKRHYARTHGAHVKRILAALDRADP